MQEHVENSTRLNADIRRLNENLETFSKLTRQLANSGAMQTVLRLVGEVQLMLQSATSAAKVYVYLPAGDEGYKSVSNPETGGTRPPEWTSTVLRGAGSSLPGNGQQDHHQGRKAKQQQGGRRARPGGIDADDLWDDLCQTVRDL